MRHRQRGFTLVEILVAVSVAALLVSLVYGAVRIGQRSARTMDSQVEQSEVMRIGWQFLHGALTRASAVPDPVEPQDRTSFQGASKSLRFVADMPGYTGRGGLMQITLSIDQSGEDQQLVVTRQRFDPLGEAPAADTTEQAVLVEDLDDLDIAYYGQADRDDAPAWHREWQGVRTLPNLISVAVKPRDATAWPKLTARPLTGTAALDDAASPQEGDPLEAEPADREGTPAEAAALQEDA